MHAMATGAIGYCLLPGVRCQAVVTVLIGRNARGRHVEARHQLRVGMAARAGDLRNIGQRNRGFGISRRQYAVLAVAVRAGSGIHNAGGHRLPMDALPVDIENILVALRAGGGHVLLPDFRTRIGGGEDVVYTVAVVAGRGFHVPRLDGATVNALLISFHRQRYVEHVFDGERGVGMALAASIRQIRFAHRRFGVTRFHHFVRRAVATLAGRRVAVEFGVRPAVNARIVLTHFLGMAGGAELHTARGGIDHIMGSMAGNARGAVLWITQHGVRAGAELLTLVRMTGNAGCRCCFRRVSTLGSPGMAIHATQVFVNAMRQGVWIHRDGFPLGIHHSGFRRVAGKTVVRGEKPCWHVG